MALPKWMQEDMGFSADEQKALDPLFTDERVQKLEAGHLRQGDYSKHMNALKKAQTDLADANERLTSEMAEWATVQAQGQKLTAKQTADLEASQVLVARLQSRVKSIATTAGLDPDKALDGIDQVTVPAKKDDVTPPIDTSNFVDREAMGRLANMALTLPAEIAAISHEHHELTGKWLDARDVVKEIQTRATTRGNQKSLEVRDVWEELHGIPTLRETKSKEKYDADIAAAEKRGAQEALTNLAIPGATPPPTHGRPSPVLHAGDGKARESVIKRPQPGTAAQSAVAALRTGKYRQQPTGSPVMAGQKT